ncbi:MAG: PAS domain S-box protein, partial [Candidatus Acidiferrales bacterium]
GVTLVRSILFDGKRVGTVVIRASLQELRDRMIERGLVAGGVLVVSLLGAFLLSSVFRRTIAQPVVDLAQVAHTVSREKNYSVRATPTGSGDEIDLLGNSFNEMLRQIEDRDAALHRSRDELEQRVRDRTAELSASNSALDDSRELYRQLFDSNPHPVWAYDLETLRFLDVNLAAMLSYGYTREEFMAMSIRDIRPADDVPLLLESVTKAKSAAEITGAWRHRKKDGSIIDVEITSHAMLYSGRPARLVVATDITARKQAEGALRASEERFRSVVEAASDAVVSADEAGNIIQFNSAAERIFGSPADEMIGQPLTVLMPPSLRSAHRAGFERYHSTGEAHVLGKTVELIGLRKNGEEFPIELSLESWRSGENVFFTGLLRDITERKRAEQFLRQQKAELESANHELEAFCYSVSHDLRAPLRGIDGFSQALLEDYADRLDARGKDHLHRVRAATQRMATLIDDLLDLSRVTRTEMRREQVDLTQCAESVAAELQKSQPQRKVEFRITPGLAAEGDARLLRQILENLLSNAWKFTSKHSSAHIGFGVTHHNGKPVFFVSDDGAGFDPAYADRLFGVFQRLHAVT